MLGFAKPQPNLRSLAFSGFNKCSGFFLFLDHPDSVGGALFGAYSAALAVLEVYRDGDSASDNALWAVQPTYEAGWTLVLGRGAFLVVYFGPEASPVPRSAGFSRAKLRMGVRELVLRLVTHALFLSGFASPGIRGASRSTSPPRGGTGRKASRADLLGGDHWIKRI